MMENPKPLITVQDNAGKEIYSKAEKERVLLEMIGHMRVLHDELENPSTEDARKDEITKELGEVNEHFQTIKKTVER